MKQIFALLLTAALVFSVVGCGAGNQQSRSSAPESGSSAASSAAPESSTPSSEAPAPVDTTEVRVAVLKGPTTMGMVRLIEDAAEGKTQSNYSFQIGTIDETTPLLAKGEVDIAALPSNVASVIYNNTDGAYQALAINTLGVVYVVEKGDSIQSVADLKGKTVLSIGKGGTPEYAVNYVLNQNGIDPAADLTLEFKSEAAEIIPLLAQSENGIAVLQQPFVANALAKVEGLRVALDWTQEWDAVANGESTMITGVVVVRRAFAEEHPELVAEFLADYQASTAYTNENPAEAAVLIEKYGIVAAAIAEQAIPACNIVFIDGDDMKTGLSGYLSVLLEQNPASIGGKLPGDDFYFSFS